MEKCVSTYLAVAITTECNYKCFYCKKGGESISKERQTIPYDKLKNIILTAMEEGIKNFRITGGEPTGVEYFGELMLKAVEELHVNVKLLDLNKFPEYYGNEKEICDKEALDFWQNMFVPMKGFYGFLEEISEYSDQNWTTQMIGKGNGIPMSSYFRKGNYIQVKDSERGAKYSKFCKESCEYYKNGACREGVFSLFLSSNLVLHLSGCKNEKIRFDLTKCSDDEIKLAFLNLLNFI